MLNPILGSQYPFCFLFLAILISTVAAGLGPALVAVALGGVASAYYFLPPYNNFHVAGVDAQVGLVTYLFSGIGIAMLGEAMQRSRRLALLALEELRIANEDLEGRVTARMADLETANSVTNDKEELLSRAFQLIPDCVSIVRLSDRIVVRANDSLCRLWGETPEEVVGQCTRDYVTWEDESRLALFLQKLDSDGECLDFETTLQLRDGRHLLFSLSSKLITIVGDICVITVMRDITEARAGQHASRSLAAIVKSSGDAIVSKSLEGVVTSWNTGAEKIFGYCSEEMIGASIRRIIPDSLSGEEDHILARIAAGISVEHYDTTRLNKRGELVDVSVTVSPVLDGSGKIIGASKIARDISRQKRQEEAIRRLNAELETRVSERTFQLEAANRELEAFSYSVSHDLRAPLRAIDGFAGIVVKDYGSILPLEGLRKLENVRRGAKQMGRLIDDLLAFSRLSRLPLEKSGLDVRRLVTEVASDVFGELMSTQVIVGELEDCVGDWALLKQVWINLISNAKKYTAKQPAPLVEIGCTRRETDTVYFIRDNGAGFDMRYAEKLFGVFQRLHRAEEYEGTGVGLAIVQRIVQRHGGTIWAEAEVEKGATFFFTLGRRTEL